MGRTSGEGAMIAHLEAIEAASETTATDGTTRTAAVATAAHQVTQNTALSALVVDAAAMEVLLTSILAKLSEIEVNTSP